MYERTHKDINRDFPYLTKHEGCMETIGARVINELYISHLFSVALSLHGGTESFTYPYGTPNHIQKNPLTPKIPMQYTIENGKAVKATPYNNSFAQAKKYHSGTYEMVVGKSTEPPDANAMAGK
jgi:hypothetical protein